MSRPTLRHLFDDSRKALKNANISEADLDAHLLVEWATDTTRKDMILEPQRLIDTALCEKLHHALQRRIAGEPVFRILGAREFYGLHFALSADTLEPRPDTEILIELILAHINQTAPLHILDMGTGSGAIVITLLHLFKNAQGLGVDLSQDALMTAYKNAHNIGVDDRFKTLQSDWFDKINQRFDLIVSNPPYIPTSDIENLEIEVRHFDPHRALDGGSDGLDFYRALASHSIHYLHSNGSVAVEIGKDQEKDVIALFQQNNYALIEQKCDLAGIVRALLFRLN